MPAATNPSRHGSVSVNSTTNSPHPLQRGLLTCSLVVVLWAVFATAMWQFDRHALNVTPDAYRGVWVVLVNALVAFSLWLLLAATTRRPFASLLLVAALQTALYVAAAIKLRLLHAPLMLPDLHFFGQINPASIRLFGSYLDLPGGPWLWIGLVLLVSAGIFAAEPASIAKRGPARFAMLLLGLAMVSTLYLAAWPWTGIYTRELLRPSRFNDLPGILRSGLVSALVYDYLHARHTVPQVDEAALRHTLALLHDPEAPVQAAITHAAPDIIVVLSESFMDPRILHGFESIQDPVPFVHRTIDAGKGGSMRVPAYGGGTVRTEFEILTGMPINAFPAVIYPYRDLRRAHMPGLASVLLERGYRTLAIHGNSGSFWNRSNTYRAMGIERFVTDLEFKPTAVLDGFWYSDESMTDFILEALQQTTRPSFILAISIQNHGPYDRSLPLRDTRAWERLEVPQALTGDDALAMRNYLYHLHSADRQFERLHRALVQRARPFVLVFFGDHLPALDFYGALGFVDGQAPTSQTVPWALIAEGTGVQSALPETTISAWQLPALTLRAAGIHDDYFDFVARAAELLEQLPADSEDRNTVTHGINSAAAERLEGRFGNYLQ